MLSLRQIKTKRLAGLCRRTGEALHAGVDIRRVWAREAERGPGGDRRRLAKVSDGLARGESVTEGVAGINGFFPPLFCEIVDVGEQTGKLDAVLLRLADHYDHQLMLGRMFLLALIWPLIELTAAVVVVGLLIGIMGRLAPQVDVLGVGLTGDKGAATYAAIVVGAAVLAVVLFRIAGRVWSRLGLLARLTLMIPGLGRCLRNLTLSRMAWSLSMTTDVGMEVRRSVALAVRSTDNSYYTRHGQRIDEAIAGGGEIHEALRACGGFPQDFLDAMEVGEQTGRLAESMAGLSKQYQQRAETALGILTVLAQFAVGLLIAAIIIAIIFQLFSIYVGQIEDALNPI